MRLSGRQAWLSRPLWGFDFEERAKHSEWAMGRAGMRVFLERGNGSTCKGPERGRELEVAEESHEANGAGMEGEARSRVLWLER